MKKEIRCLIDRVPSLLKCTGVHRGHGFYEYVRIAHGRPVSSHYLNASMVEILTDERIEEHTFVEGGITYTRLGKYETN